MKRAVGGFAALCMALALWGCGGNQPPEGISGEAYAIGLEALQTTDAFLDGRTTVETAQQRLEALYTSLLQVEAQDTLDSTLGIRILLVEADLFLVLYADGTPQGVVQSRNDLAETLEQPQR